MSLKPEIGDTVIIRGVVVKAVSEHQITIRTPSQDFENCLYNWDLNITLERISEIIPKPWRPIVGDYVKINTYPRAVFSVRFIDKDDYVTLKCIHSDSNIFYVNHRCVEKLKNLSKADVCAD